MRPRSSQSLRGPVCSLCDIIHYGYFHQISLLVSKGIDVTARDAFNRTPLILCAFMEPQEWGVGVAMTLIEHGVYLGDRDCFGRNVLHYACIYERQNLVRILLRAIDFDLDQADTLGNTPLHYAAMSGNVAVTTCLVKSFRKYRISANKVNRCGRTALGEAMLSGKAACARVIELELTPEQQENNMTNVHFTEDFLVGSRSAKVTSQRSPALWTHKSRRPLTAAVVGRRASSSSMIAAHQGRPFLSSVSAASTSRQSRCNRKSHNPLYANGYRRDEDIIHCVPNEDFRNTPDYVCKLVRLPCHTHCWGNGAATDLAIENTPWADTVSTCQAQQTGTGWRRELEQLFKVYEYQCSASWRASVQLDQPAAAPPASTPGAEEEDKGKKGRTSSSVSRTGHWKDNPDPRKRVSSVRSRKIPNGKYSGGASVDGSLDTSSDSINSLVSSKRRGMEKENNLARPESSVMKQRVKSAKGTHSQVQSSTMFTSSSPLPTSTTSKNSPSAGNTASQVVNIKGNLTSPGNNIINPAATTSTRSSTLNGALAPSPVPIQKMTVDTSSLTRKNSNQSSNSTRKDDVATLPKITVVRETHIREERRSTSGNFQEQVDTNKLWVQNPYENNNDDTDEEGGANN